MSYLDISDPKLLDDLSKRKEFYIYNINPYENKSLNIFEQTQTSEKHLLEELFKQEIYLEPHSYQHAIQNFLSPDTPYTRLLAKWATGHGKTIFSLLVGMEFINRFINSGKGKVFILGFNENIFKKDLLKFPEFGFISRSEIRELHKLTTKSKSGLERDISAWQDYVSLLKRRITSGKGNGLFQFYGYKAFVNRLFISEEGSVDINTMNEEQIRRSVQDGSLKINIELLDSFDGSMMICDEIHNVYNSLEKNNWGIAIQVILDHHPKLKAVFLSATPMNNSPTEIVDLLNMLVPGTKKYRKVDFFDGNKLLPGAESQLRKLLRGRVSFIQDTNPRYFPKQTLYGESIPGINYLKFNRAVMSKFHFDVYKKEYKGTLSQDSQYLIDLALPDPTGETSGLYQTASIIRKISSAPAEWKKKYGIDYKEKIGLTGDFMKSENIGKYSAKMKLVLDDIMELLKGGINVGKIFIYHNVVHISGVLFIQEMLRINGILLPTQDPSENTPCSICGKIMKLHTIKTQVTELESVSTKIGGKSDIIMLNKNDTDYTTKLIDKVSNGYVVTADTIDNNTELTHFDVSTGGKSELIKDHNFEPVRLLAVHSNIDKSEVEKNIERYNIDDNIEGKYYKFLIGSRLIKEAYSFEGVRVSMIVGRTDNIPTLIQVLGRGKRKKSHAKLPEDKRTNQVRIYTTTLPGKKLSHEEIKYKEKMQDYLIIQNIEKIMHEVAVDAVIVRPIIERGLKEENMDLYLLPYTPESKIKEVPVNKLIESTYESFHFHKEIQYITYIIKRIFIEVGTVFTYDELWKLVRNPTFIVEFNSAIFSEDYFIIALNGLTRDEYNESNYIYPLISKIDNNSTIIDILRNSIDRRIIFPNNQQNFITYKEGFYILVPWIDRTEFADVEYPFRNIKLQLTDSNIKVGKYIKNISSESNYDMRKVHFKSQYGNLSMSMMSNVLSFYNVDFHVRFLEEAIKYIFDVWVSPSNNVKSEFHEFYFKIVYYYDILGVIIWASTAKEYLLVEYQKYILNFKSNNTNTNTNTKRLEFEYLMSSSSDTIKHKDAIKTNKIMWIPPEIKNRYKENLSDSLKLLNKSSIKKKNTTKNTTKNTKDIIRTDAEKLPIGHFLKNIPRFYRPDLNWHDVPDYVISAKEYKENDLIVGYHEKSAGGFKISFKLRTPIHKIVRYEDVRKIEKGSICSTYSKSFLIELLKNLGDTADKTHNVPTLCQRIESRLLYNELQERKKGTRIKWFYSFWEPRPDQHFNNNTSIPDSKEEENKSGGDYESEFITRIQK
jgi:hypothetical protein